MKEMCIHMKIKEAIEKSKIRSEELKQKKYRKRILKNNTKIANWWNFITWNDSNSKRIGKIIVDLYNF